MRITERVVTVSCVSCLAICPFGVQAAATPILGPLFNSANRHAYYLLDNSTWSEAEAEAIRLGGHLATINDQAENAWVSSRMAAFGGIGRRVWIGLNDAATEGTFVWSSGETTTYRNWSASEPNNLNGREDYVHIYNFQGNPWNDIEDVAGPTTYPRSGAVEVVPRPGDANMNLRVEFDDLLIVAQNYGVTTNVNWSRGDFDWNGRVDFDDLLILAQAYGSASFVQQPDLPAAFTQEWSRALSLIIPEPVHLSTLVLAPLATRRRRLNDPERDRVRTML